MGRESLANHDQIPKKALILDVCACEGFSYVWRDRRVRALHRESTDSLILIVFSQKIYLTSFGGDLLPLGGSDDLGNPTHL